MVRSEFGVDPDTLSDEQFVELWTEAAWLMRHRLEQLGKLLGAIR